KPPGRMTQSSPLRSRSLCQMNRASWRRRSCTAWWQSRSDQVPGKTTIPKAAMEWSLCPRDGLANLEAEVLDHGVGQQLLAHLLHPPLGVDAVVGGDLDHQALARPHLLHLDEAQVAQAV